MCVDGRENENKQQAVFERVALYFLVPDFRYSTAVTREPLKSENVESVSGLASPYSLCKKKGS